jgi:HD-like signal output (HDOD) protein
VTPPASAPPAGPAGPLPSAGPAVPAGAVAGGAATSEVARLQTYVHRILVADDFPSFSRQMGELMASLQEGEASAQRLANLVLRDYALTVKVIRTSNTVHYNRTGRPVQSATHAMMLLGAQTVRDLASSLLLFEQYRNRTPGLKELMLLSLLTAGHAREAAARLGLVDPETAQLCGMFRNLGEVLVAAHLPAENAAILRGVGDRGGKDARRARDAAAASVLGCSFEDIGVAIAGDWGMPAAVCRGMRATGERGEGELELVTAFAHDLTLAIYREGAGAARQGVAAVLERYGTRLKITRDVLAAITDEAVAATRETFAAAGVALDGLRLTRQLAAALSSTAPGDAPAADAARSMASTPPAGTPGLGGEAEGPPTSGPALAALRERLVKEVEAAATDPAAGDLRQFLLVVLEAVVRGAPCDRACFCAVDVPTQELRARFGLGDGVEELVPRLQIPCGAGASGAGIGAPLLRGEELFLAGGRLALRDAQLLRAWGAGGAGMLPIVLDGATIGCLYLDRRGGAVAMDAGAVVYLRRLAAATVRAIVARRAGTPSAGTPSAGQAAPAHAAAPAAPVSDAPPVGRSPQQKVECAMRVVRGERAADVAASVGATTEEVEQWHAALVEAALARMGG